ncbi:cysteine rich repeat-containing protein [Labrys okinawensis]|uniref:cysteine rich repeat-containing protein n=1 Tax=Labrys okinawensis TaxID=346911 RepID=UPI0039BCBFB7
MNGYLTRSLTVAGLALGALVLLLPATAFPQMSPEMKSQARTMLKPCLPDYRKFCSNVEKGNGRIVQCLISHKDELSAACKQGMISVKALQNKQDGQ